MDFKIIFHETFVNDLERIVRSVAIHHAAAAVKLGETIIQMCESLEFFPERHPRVRQRPTLRRFVTKKYFKVFYRVQHATKTVEILRCWDARQEIEPRISN